MYHTFEHVGKTRKDKVTIEFATNKNEVMENQIKWYWHKSLEGIFGKEKYVFDRFMERREDLR